LRKASRAVSQFYDEMLRPVGIRGTKYSLLVAIKLSGPVLVTKLAENVTMDRTTLTRNLEILIKQGLVDVGSGDDRRTRRISITGQGLAVLNQAFPLWQQAQVKLRDGMGHAQMGELLRGLSALVALIQK
jgi:DNA-binding MarR family transcriptional regulator